MLKRLHIKNFKGWEDTGELNLAPLTLFFGANSSGKSSLGQFLMLLKQTAESNDRKAVLYPGGRNSPVQLGSFYDIVYGHDLKRPISFSYQWTLAKPLEVTDPDSKKKFSGNALSFNGMIQATLGEHQPPFVQELQYALLQDNKMVLDISMTRKAEGKPDYSVQANNYPLKRNKGRPLTQGAPISFYGFPDEVVAYHQNADFVQDLNLTHGQLFGSISYLGPMRTKAERLYTWSGIEPESVGYAGENTVAALLAARDRKINLGQRKKYKQLDEIIAEKMMELGLVEDFQVQAISEQRREYEVKVRTKGSDHFVVIPDVGFGISQVFPVLVQSFFAPPNSIVVMEQPEIHLHPSAQSALADVLVSAVQARENGAPRNVQLLIETHSEHLLRRLQRRIAEEQVPPELVAVYFADITKTPATLQPLELDIYGNIRNWPENFFGDEMADITAQARAGIARRQNKHSAGVQP